MLKNALTSFGESYRLILKDKVSFLLALTPIVIGLLLYYFAGVKFFSFMVEFGQNYIESYLGTGNLGAVVGWIVKIILTIFLYYVVNLTFILIISLIASPFNDALSGRIEKQLLKEPLAGFDTVVRAGLKKVFFTLGTEIKKITFIVLLSMLVLIFGFIPLLTPISLLMGAMLLSMEFIDFSWSRHDMNFKSCLGEFKSGMVGYTVGGLFFMFLISVPVINLVVPSLATSYFTILWVKNNEYRN